VNVTVKCLSTHMPLVEDQGSFDCMAASLRAAATPLRMTALNVEDAVDILCGERDAHDQPQPCHPDRARQREWRDLVFSCCDPDRGRQPDSKGCLLASASIARDPRLSYRCMLHSIAPLKRSPKFRRHAIGLLGSERIHG
jgi:hypothetical protein